MREKSSAAAYGIREREQDGDALAFHVERIRAIGYSVLDSGISRQDIDRLSASLDAILDRQAQEFGGIDQLVRIGDAYTARCPLVYDDGFVELVRHPLLLRLCRRLLGEYVQLMQQNGVVNPPGENHPQGVYHRDLPYQHFVSSRPLAVSALFCIDPFRVETGATTVLPASHLNECFPSDEVRASHRDADRGSAGRLHRVRLDVVPSRRCEPLRTAAAGRQPRLHGPDHRAADCAAGGAGGTVRRRSRAGAAPGL